MKICLVGNGRHDKWHTRFGKNASVFIDSCDIVIRENACGYYYMGYSGWKSDVLVLRSATEGGTGRPISELYDNTVPERVARDVSRVVVCAESDEDTIESGIVPHCERYGWPLRITEFMPFSYDQKTRDACQANPRYEMATLGSIALYWALEQWPTAEVFLSGYVFVYLSEQLTQTTHDVEAEYNWIHGLAHDGRLTLLE